MYPAILVTDVSGTPKEWTDVETAICYYAKNKVAWEAGSTIKIFRGGINALSGERSHVDVNSIIAVTGPTVTDKMFRAEPILDRRSLFVRDRFICAYCGDKFHDHELTKEHIHPQSRGGKDTWTNVVSACVPCNHRKEDKTPEEAGMKLMYVPYTPNVFENMILQNRKILADQMEFLLARVPRHSRMHPQ